MIRVRFLPVLVFVAASSIAIPSASAGASTTEVELALEASGRVDALIVQVWDGEEGAKFRQSLDILFGNGDGALAADEIEKITTAAETDMKSKTFPMVRLDGEPAEVVEVVVTLEGAEGSVIGVEPVKLVHEIDLATAPLGDELHELAFSPRTDGRFVLRVPEGWRAEVVTGLGDATEGPGTVEGQATGGRNATLVVSPGAGGEPLPDDGIPEDDEEPPVEDEGPVEDDAPSGNDTPGETFANLPETPAAPVPSGRSIPAASVAVVLAVAGSIAAAVRRGRQ